MVAKLEFELRLYRLLIKDEIVNYNFKDNIESIKIDKALVSDPIEIATAFNIHYINIGLTSNTDIKTSPKKKSIAHSMIVVNLCLKMKNRMMIMSLKDTNSEGHDEINMNIVKSHTIEPSAIVIFNLFIFFT